MNLARGSGLRCAFVLACLCLLPAPLERLAAATFEGLYTVSIARDPSTAGRLSPAAQRAQAAQRAMAILLTRITGRQQAAAYPELRSLIDNAGDYLNAYYELPGGNESRVEFRDSQVNQALTRLNMPIWGNERPATLLWIASELANGQRAELGASDDAEAIRAGAVGGVPSNPLSDDAAAFFESIVDEILTAAEERGLPLVLPELDARDRQYVRFADVWGGFDELVARAAERYAVDAVVIARVSPTDGGAAINWTVRRGERVDRLSAPRARVGIDWLADEFASQYTTIGDARLTWITIREIRSWPDYRVLDYLESVSLIESANAESLSTDGELLVRITARGDDSALERVLMLDGELAPVENATGLVFVPAWRAGPETLDAP